MTNIPDAIKRKIFYYVKMKKKLCMKNKQNKTQMTNWEKIILTLLRLKTFPFERHC